MMQGSTSDRCNMLSGSSGAARRTHVLGDITNTQGEQRRLQNNQPVGEECASVLNQNIKRGVQSSSPTTPLNHAILEETPQSCGPQMCEDAQMRSVLTTDHGLPEYTPQCQAVTDARMDCCVPERVTTARTIIADMIATDKQIHLDSGEAFDDDDDTWLHRADPALPVAKNPRAKRWYSKLQGSVKSAYLDKKREYQRNYRKNLVSNPLKQKVEGCAHATTFYSGVWEPRDPVHGTDENDLDQLDPDVADPGTCDTDDAGVVNMRGFDYEYRKEPRHIDADTIRCSDAFRNLPKVQLVLKTVANCWFCNAKRFPGEGPSFCCRQGKVFICRTDFPDELRRLFQSQTDRDARYFRENIRYFNSHFSFTSFGVSLDRNLATARGTGVYTFKAHGQIYHKLDQLVPGDKGPCHMQLYFYDTDHQISHRTTRSPGLDEGLIRKILSVLQQNPYVQTLKCLGNVTNLEEYKIELNTTISVDQRRFNAPTSGQVAAIWMDGNDPERRFDRSIFVFGHSDRPYYVRAYHGCYDPLGYPLFFPNGETGWEDKNILYRDPPSSKPKRSYRRRGMQGVTSRSRVALQSYFVRLL